MDLNTLLGLLAGLGVPIIGAILAVGRAFQRLNQHGEEIAELRETSDQHAARLLESEKVRSDVTGLTSAIKGLSELFAEKFTNLTDKLASHSGESSRRFDDMRRENERRFNEISERLAAERRSFRSPDK